uniref:Uncharacterized protein n=1 Tax=Timema cristinae TaxID=61476 RepID=A0A7R9H1W0_TIMCR|nr:unnamed protein product [Timema cristinae]
MSKMDEKCLSSTSKLSAKTVVKADISKTSRKRKYSNESVACNKRIIKVNSVTEQKVSQGNVQQMEEQGENKKLTTLSHDCKQSTSKASQKTVGIADVAKTSRKRKYNNESVASNTRTKKVNSVTEQKVSQGNVKKLEEQGETNNLTALSHDCKPSTSKASRKTRCLSALTYHLTITAVGSNSNRECLFTDILSKSSSVLVLREFVILKHKAESVLKLISKKGQLTPQLEDTISLASTLEELDLISSCEYKSKENAILLRDDLKNIQCDLNTAVNKMTGISPYKALDEYRPQHHDGSLTDVPGNNMYQPPAGIQKIYAPYKESNKGTLAQRARQHGLECIALEILNGTTEISHRMIHNLVNPYVEDLKTVHKVEQVSSFHATAIEEQVNVDKREISQAFPFTIKVVSPSDVVPTPHIVDNECFISDGCRGSASSVTACGQLSKLHKVEVEGQIEMQGALNAELASPHNTSDLTMLTAQDWRHIHGLVVILQPLAKATEIGDNYLTSSMIKMQGSLA